MDNEINLLKRRSRREFVLHERDKLLVKLVSEGRTSKDIASMSNVSHRTVEGVLDMLCRVYQCRNRVQLVAKFIREGLI